MNDFEKSKYVSIGSDQLLRFGLGMSKIGSQFSSSLEHIKGRLSVLDCASDYGKIFLDTASIYGGGFSESIVGDYLKKKRSKFFLATKFYPSELDSKAQMERGIEESLNRLNTDSVDLLQIHWPNALLGNDFLADFLMTIKNKGYCKNFGVCNYNEIELVEIEKLIIGGHIASNQIEFNLLTCALFSREKIKSNQYLTIAYGVLNQGRLAASEKQRAALQLLAGKLNVSIETLVLAWALSYENLLPLMKISTLTHLKPLLQALNVRLSEQDIMSIEEYSLNNIAYINLSDINLIGDGHRSPYLLEAEARENIQNLFPSPASLAKRFIDGNIVLPLKVHQEKDGTYTVDPYDPIGQSKIYWGWSLAFPNSRIPAHILNT